MRIEKVDPQWSFNNGIAAQKYGLDETECLIISKIGIAPKDYFTTKCKLKVQAGAKLTSAEMALLE